MKKLKAYWLRFWHCLYYTGKELHIDHRMYTEYENKKVTYIGCCCGKSFYGKKNKLFYE